jgi:hypothetical protein
VTIPIDPATGTIISGGVPGAFTEYFRRDPSGNYEDMQYKVVSRAEVESAREESYQDERGAPGPQYYPWEGPPRGGGWYVDRYGRVYRQQPSWSEPPPPPRRNFLDELFGTDNAPRPGYGAPRRGPFDWLPNLFN